MQCPYCSDLNHQVKNGLNNSGSQRYRCNICYRNYTAQPTLIGYSEQVRKNAIFLYLQGKTLREVGEALTVNHQSVANWVSHAGLSKLPTFATQNGVQRYLEKYLSLLSLHPQKYPTFLSISLAKLSGTTRKHALAIKNYQEYFQLAAQKSNKSLELTIALQIGTISAKLTQFETSINYYLHALNCAAKHTPYTRTFVKVHIADTHFAIEEYENAAEYYERALIIAARLEKEALSTYLIDALQKSNARQRDISQEVSAHD